MTIQTATTGNLDDAQRITIAAIRYTLEHNAPCADLVEHFTLGKGEKSMTVPKAGRATAHDLTDGVDMTDTEDIGLTTVTLTTAEVGLKFILTDKLVRQMNEDAFKVIGRQMGDAMAYKKDTDVIALFSALNGGTVKGADGAYLKVANAQACVAFLKAQKAPPPWFFVHHPYAVAYLASQAATTMATYPAPEGWAMDRLKSFYKGIQLDQCSFFEDGNIEKISGYDSGYGCVASKSAMCVVSSKEMGEERERDASLRAWEVVVVADYGCFELDDTYGAAAQYEIGAISTSA